MWQLLEGSMGDFFMSKPALLKKGLRLLLIKLQHNKGNFESKPALLKKGLRQIRNLGFFGLRIAVETCPT